MALLLPEPFPVREIRLGSRQLPQSQDTPCISNTSRGLAAHAPSQCPRPLHSPWSSVTLSQPSPSAVHGQTAAQGPVLDSAWVIPPPIAGWGVVGDTRNQRQLTDSTATTAALQALYPEAGCTTERGTVTYCAILGGVTSRSKHSEWSVYK